MSASRLKQLARGPHAGFLQATVKDLPEVGPLLLAVAAGCALGVFTGARTLLQNPGVHVGKGQRQDGLDFLMSEQLREKGHMFYDHPIRRWARRQPQALFERWNEQFGGGPNKPAPTADCHDDFPCTRVDSDDAS
eukprot:1192292-Prorocentrum_minimum.AAC.4